MKLENNYVVKVKMSNKPELEVSVGNIIDILYMTRSGNKIKKGIITKIFKYDDKYECEVDISTKYNSNIKTISLLNILEWNNVNCDDIINISSTLRKEIIYRNDSGIQSFYLGDIISYDKIGYPFYTEDKYQFYNEGKLIDIKLKGDHIDLDIDSSKETYSDINTLKFNILDDDIIGFELKDDKPWSITISGEYIILKKKDY